MLVCVYLFFFFLFLFATGKVNKVVQNNTYVIMIITVTTAMMQSNDVVNELLLVFKMTRVTARALHSNKGKMVYKNRSSSVL